MLYERNGFKKAKSLINFKMDLCVILNLSKCRVKGNHGVLHVHADGNGARALLNQLSFCLTQVILNMHEFMSV